MKKRIIPSLPCNNGGEEGEEFLESKAARGGRRILWRRNED